MITIVQRVGRARVSVDDQVVGAIDRGLLLLVGVERGDTEADAETTAKKVAAMRLFPSDRPMDRSITDIRGGCLVVSQFTLAADLRHGNRPDFTAAADPAVAAPLYERVAGALAAAGLEVATGRFGASMQVELVNDGPVTVVLTVRSGKVVARSRAQA
ncbi:MAG: D-tyrosyl-tRNA(Tyr) deacylase [Planctomycetes bacterium]|nr:D-tyrosyl-tRNA(Tyr) deacylase [Planctomycetota bacterium]